jgi:hypothetical protein
MLGEADLEYLADLSADFADAAEEQHDALRRFLLQHQKLIKSYRHLQSRYEEERAARDRNKKIESDQVSQ